MKKLFSWKGLRTAGLVGLGIVGAFAIVSGVGLLSFVPTAAAIVLSAVTTGAAIGGLGLIGATAVAAAVKGLVNGIRYVFNIKDYRNRVKALIEERKQERDNKKKNKKDKNKDKENTKEPTILAEPVVEEKPVIEKAKTPKETSKAAGLYYDHLSSEYQELYDNMVAKRKSIFDNMPLDQVRGFVAVAEKRLDELKNKAKSGQKLTDEEQKEVVEVSVLHKKAKGVLNKARAAAESNVAEFTSEQFDELKNKAVGKSK